MNLESMDSQTQPEGTDIMVVENEAPNSLDQEIDPSRLDTLHSLPNPVAPTEVLIATPVSKKRRHSIQNETRKRQKKVK